MWSWTSNSYERKIVFPRSQSDRCEDSDVLHPVVWVLWRDNVRSSASTRVRPLCLPRVALTQRILALRGAWLRHWTDFTAWQLMLLAEKSLQPQSKADKFFTFVFHEKYSEKMKLYKDIFGIFMMKHYILIWTKQPLSNCRVTLPLTGDALHLVWR